jgi:hypothetical protein
MSKIKDAIVSRCLDYLRKHHSETMRGLTSQQIQDMVHCVADWLVTERSLGMIETSIEGVRHLTDKTFVVHEEPKVGSKTFVSHDDIADGFMDDLQKL